MDFFGGALKQFCSYLLTSTGPKYRFFTKESEINFLLLFITKTIIYIKKQLLVFLIIIQVLNSKTLFIRKKYFMGL